MRVIIPIVLVISGIFLLGSGVSQTEKKVSNKKADSQKLWEKSSIWREYKECYKKISKTESYKQAKILEKRIDRLREYRLYKLFPEQREVTYLLSRLLFVTLNSKLDVLRPRGPRREARPNWSQVLERRMKFTQMLYDLYNRLHEISWDPKWVNNELAPRLKLSIESIKIIKKSLLDDNREHPNKESLCKQADELFDRLHRDIDSIGKSKDKAP